MQLNEHQRVILVVTSDPVVLQDLVCFLGPTYMVRGATSVSSARDLFAGRDHVTAAILDHQLPDGTGLDVAREVRARKLPWPLMIVQERPDQTMLEQAESLGVDLIPRSPQPEHLEVLARRIDASEQMHQVHEAAILDRYAKVHRLTPREKQVFQLAAAKVPRMEIIERLGITRDTLKSHTRAILRKTGANTLGDLARRVAKIVSGEEPEPTTAPPQRPVRRSPDAAGAVPATPVLRPSSRETQAPPVPLRPSSRETPVPTPILS